MRTRLSLSAAVLLPLITPTPARPQAPVGLMVVAAMTATPSHTQNPLTKIKKAIGTIPKVPPAVIPKPAPAPAPGPAPGAAPVPAGPAAPVGQALNAKVTETLMGPRVTGNLMSRVVMSEDGDHLAVVAAKGSRQVVLLDGVEGPVFDEVPLNFAWSSNRESGASMVFSPTGGHSAYVARRGGDFIAVVDGKEAVTLMTPATNAGTFTTAGWGFRFNGDGSRLAYAARADSGAWVMVVDGVKSPPYRSIDFRQTVLNGKRLVYVAQTADQQSHAVVDGKAGPGYAGIWSLQVTPDGAHYGYEAQPAGTQHRVAVVDGVESKGAGFGIYEFELAPDGRFSFVGVIKPGDAQGRGYVAALFVGGRELPGSCGTVSSGCPTWGNRQPGGYTPKRHVAWSPDGKSFAFIQSNAPTPDITVIVNGKPMGPTYMGAAEPAWSPDGSRFAYLGNSRTGFFMVIDGQELTAVNDVPEFHWSPDSKRYAFRGTSGIIVDGKDQPKTQGYAMESLRWSPDGKHLAFGVSGFTGNQPVVDGVTQPFSLGAITGLPDPSTPVAERITFGPFVFSPDGNRLAYLGATMTGTTIVSKGGMVVDGVRFEGPGVSYAFPSFSSDSKHFAAAAATASGTGWAVMVDGKVGPTYENMLANNRAACRFVNDHTVRFYGVKGGQIYRVTLDIS